MLSQILACNLTEFKFMLCHVSAKVQVFSGLKFLIWKSNSYVSNFEVYLVYFSGDAPQNLN